jgi:hypothetical protein
MRQIVKFAGLAALMAVGIGAGTTPAAAQFDIRIGPDRPRYERRFYEDERPRYVERRYVRPGRRTVCTMRWRDGRRVEVCRTVGPRF